MSDAIPNADAFLWQSGAVTGAIAFDRACDRLGSSTAWTQGHSRDIPVTDRSPRTDSAGRTITASSQRPIGDRDKIILFVGRVHPEKGVHLFWSRRSLTAHGVLFTDWKLLIVGPTGTRLGGEAKADFGFASICCWEGEGKITFTGPI